MSKFRMKWAIASALLLLAYAQVSFAQVSQMRLFSPYPDDQFGGGAYAKEGLYGSIGAGMLTIGLPPNQVVGFEGYGDDSPYGEQPWYVTNEIAGVYTLSRVTNQIDTSMLEQKFSSTTEFEVGRQIGHHGWSVRGQIYTPRKYSLSGLDSSINIYDPQVVRAADFLAEATSGKQSADYWVYTGGAVGSDSSFTKLTANSQARIGRLWAIVDMKGNGQTSSTTSHEDDDDSSSTTGDDDDELTNTYALVPIPFIFDMFEMETKVNYWSVEAMYNYRLHPFRTGQLELLAGARYTVFDDKMKLTGHATTKTENSYTDTRIRILESGSTAAAGGASTSSESEEVNDDDTTETSSFSGTDLGWSYWNFDAQNHIVGPQVGGRYTIANGRWRFGGEAKFFGGFNRQNIRGNGQFGFKAESSQEGTTNSSDGSDNDSGSNSDNTGGLPTKAPLHTLANRFSYVKHFNQFTPGVESKVEASWYWTEAVSFKVGYEFMFLGDIARSTAVNDYVINEDGTFFRCKENKKDRNYDTLIHGIMFTAQINK